MKGGHMYERQQLQSARRLYEQGKEESANGHHSEAAAHFREATLIQEVHLGKYHQDTIKSYWRCGRAFSNAGNEREALRAFQRAARMSETAFSPSINASLWQDIQQNWQDMQSRSNGGSGNSNSNSDASASANGDEQALKQMAEVFSLERQGDASCKNGDFTKAAEFYQRVLDIQDSLVGADSLDGADVRCKLACCYLRKNQLQQAETALRNAHECFLQQFGEQHPATLGAAASMRTVRGKYDGNGNGNTRTVTRTNSLIRKGWFSASLSSIGSGSGHGHGHGSRHATTGTVGA